MTRWILVVATAAFLPGRPAHADDWNIYPDGSGDAPTIQAAVDAASDGDTIVLWPGSYREKNNIIQVYQKSLTVRAQGGKGSAIIEDTVLAFFESPEVEVSGIAFVARTFSGAGFRAGYCGDVMFENLTYSGFKDAAYTLNTHKVTLRRCTFTDNERGAGGAGAVGFIASGGDFVEISECVFKDNISYGPSGGGLDIVLVEEALVRRCVFINNSGGAGAAAYISSSALEFQNNTVIGNSYVGPGPGSAVFVAPNDGTYVSHNIFAFNTTYGLRLDEQGLGVASCSCNAYYQNAEAGGLLSHGQWYGDCPLVDDDWDNVFDDPQFCDVDSEDYRLMDSSPLRPENFPDGVESCSATFGAFEGSGCVSPTVRTTWGQIKSEFAR